MQGQFLALSPLLPLVIDYLLFENASQPIAITYNSHVSLIYPVVYVLQQRREPSLTIMSAPEFGVQVTNAFALLNDDNPKPKKNVSKKVEPAAKKEEQKPPRATEKAPGPGTKRGQRTGGRGRAPRPRGRGGDRPPRREHDRHDSGTGRTRDAKKGGAGKYNWGAEGEVEGDGKESGRPPRRRNNRRPAPAEPKESEEAAAEEPKEEPEEEPEPEDTTLTIDEFLAKKSTVEGDKIAVREVANDDSRFKVISALKVDEEEVNEYVVGAQEGGAGKKALKKKNKKKAEKIHLDEFVKTNGSGSAPRPASARGSGRGGRGAGRGRGSGRGGAFKMSDDQFPTLGK